MNSVKAGSSIKIKFSLSGDFGTTVITRVGVGVITGSCATTAGPTVWTSQTTAVSAKYDPTMGQYLYTWQTADSWLNTCKQLVIWLNDGSMHQADFQFTK